MIPRIYGTYKGFNMISPYSGNHRNGCSSREVQAIRSWKLGPYPLKFRPKNRPCTYIHISIYPYIIYPYIHISIVECPQLVGKPRYSQQWNSDVRPQALWRFVDSKRIVVCPLNTWMNCQPQQQMVVPTPQGIHLRPNQVRAPRKCPFYGLRRESKPPLGPGKWWPR